MAITMINNTCVELRRGRAGMRVVCGGTPPGGLSEDIGTVSLGEKWHAAAHVGKTLEL
jgi:hypothetical protein